MMELSSSKYALLIIWFYISFVSVILLFGRGLLLHRDVLPFNASCIEYVPNNCVRELKNNGDLRRCLNSLNGTFSRQYCAPTNFKVVLLIIDALRYDFVNYNYSIPLEDRLPYENKLPIIYNALETHPYNSRLYKFIADPPTTTMQRINGLTTGSLPTFIDIGSNFASSEINEDNIIDRILAQNKNIVFMGDDTWVKAYPNRFVRSYPFDSFNVWDLDTVDTGVKLNLFPELKKDDWHLLIAHFLGVDHCGHRYGPNHSEMERKLTEMNNVIRDVIEELENRTDVILLVMGDHGMTSTGDHGGETENEISSALFAYSPVITFLSKWNVESVRQVDFVPTLSTVLGIAIPFSNTGSIIINCLPTSLVNSTLKITLFLWRNANQITNYIKEYFDKNGQFSENELNEILRFYISLKHDLFTADLDNINLAVKKYKTYMKTVSQLCQNAWVQFDKVCLLIGLFLTCVITIFTYLLIQILSLETFCNIFSSRYIIFCLCLPILSILVSYIVYVSDLFIKFELSIYFFIGLFSFLQLLAISLRMRKLIKLVIVKLLREICFVDIFITACYIFSIIGLFSNSYIIEESSVVSFLLISSLWVLLWSHSNDIKISFYNHKVLTYLANYKTFIIGLIFALIYRLFLNYSRCREESAYCIQNKYEYSLWHCSMAIAIMVSYICIIQKILQYNGNSHGNILNTVVCMSVQRWSGILISFYWIGEYYPVIEQYIHRIPSIVLTLCVLSLCHTLYDSLCIYYEPSVQKMYRKLGSKLIYYLKEQLSYDKVFSSIHGIATIYSALFFNISVLLCIICSVTLYHVYVPSMVFMTVTLWFLASITSTTLKKVPFKSTEIYDVEWKQVVIWGISCMYWFYATGHNASFSDIQWNAAFLIHKEINNFFLPGILVLINTFSSYIMHAFLLPVLLIFPVTVNCLQPRVFCSFNDDGSLKVCGNELILVQQENRFHHMAFILVMKYLLFFAVRLLVMMISATIHCRHLMMWQIFAPKLIFEVTAFIVVTIPCSLFSFIFVLRVTKQVKSLFLNYPVNVNSRP